MEKVKTKSKKRKQRKCNKIISIVLLGIILILFAMLFYLNIIPIIYLILILIVTMLVIGITIFCNFNKIRGVRIIGYTLSTIIAIASLFIIVYLYNTLGFLFNITNGNYALKTYNVLVLKNSSYQKIKDLDNKKIGISSTTEESSLKDVKDKIAKKVDVSYENYEDIDILVKGIYDKEVEAIILENSEIELLKENNAESYEGLRIIYDVEIKNDIENLKEAVNINKEPFNVYISGIDTYGKINSSSRSDVNILVSVNPRTEKILITWIPRDYYVNINNSTYKDKLTHAGMYGIDSSIYAIEHLLDVNINYYVKVNFSSVIKTVDVLKGITVYNDETFTTNENITFKKGYVTLNGEQALSFVRDRKHVTGGDLGRGKNQIKVLEALINKAMSKEIIKTYNKLLNTLNDSFVTNISQNAMAGFIRKEIQSPRKWQLESQTLSGKDAYRYTYTYRNTELYVMEPDESVVSSAKEKIQSVINN